MTDAEQLREEVQQLKDSFDTLSKEVRALLNLWEQAKGVVTFVKWCAAVGSAVAAFILFIKPYLK